MSNVQNMTKRVEEEEQAPPTENEVAIAKAEVRVEAMKHIDAKLLALNYIFPLLRKLAAESGDIAEALEDAREETSSLVSSVEALMPSDDLVAVLEASRDMIVNMAGLLDQTMVAAGFCTVSKKDGQVVMSVSDKMPKELRTVYEQIGPAATEVVTDIQDAIAAAGDEDEDDDEDEVGVEEDEDTQPGFIAARAEPVAIVDTVDAAIEALPGTPGAPIVQAEVAVTEVVTEGTGAGNAA